MAIQHGSVRAVPVNGLEKVTLLLGDSWLGRRTRLALTVVEFLAIKKNFVRIVVLASGAMLEFPSRPNRLLEINADTTQADVYRAVQRVMGSGYIAKLYKDQTRNAPLSCCEVALGPIDNGTMYVDILEGFDSWKCLKTFQGHSQTVTSMAFSPDGRAVVSASYDKTLKLWSVSGGECLKTFQGHSKIVLSVAFSPDGRTVVSGAADNTLKLWSVSGGECLKTFQGHSKIVESVAFSPDGRTVVSASCDNTLKLWSVFSGECLNTFQDHSAVIFTVAFSPDGRTVVSGSDCTLKLWGAPEIQYVC